jgi:hypothetical protein
MSETDSICQADPASLLDTLHSWDTRLASTTAGYLTRLYAGFYTISVLASLWVYFVARRLPPGPLRALACLPVVLLQMAATPFLVDRHRTAVLIVPVCGIFSLSAFKVGPGIVVSDLVGIEARTSNALWHRARVFRECIGLPTNRIGLAKRCTAAAHAA